MAAPTILPSSEPPAPGEPAWPHAEDGVGAALDLARDLGATTPVPGAGRTAERWELLGRLGSHDLTVARAVEPHLDALAILAEAGLEPGAGAYGVWAAEGPGRRLEATESSSEGWTLSGEKPWCSLAGTVDRALVTAWVDDEHRALFDVDARHRGLEVDDSAWVPHGLRRITTSSVRLDRVPARMVGAPGWYLERPGFAWGGVGVAAVWLGAARALQNRLVAAARRREPDQIALMHLGEADATLWSAGTALQSVAALADSGRPTSAESALAAARARLVAAQAAEDLLARVGRALGPAPLAMDPEHAQRVADLTLYVRQHHGERDAAALGSLSLESRP